MIDDTIYLTIPKPTPGRVVLYRTDGRNGLTYDLPAIITCTTDSHPGDYPDGSSNPLPVPDPGRVHLTVLTPGGRGTKVVEDDHGTTWDPEQDHTDDSVFVGASRIIPGSGTYVELNVPHAGATDPVNPRSWRYPPRTDDTIQVPA